MFTEETMHNWYVCVCVCVYLHQLRQIISQLIVTAALNPAHSNFSHLCVSKPEFNKTLRT